MDECEPHLVSCPGRVDEDELVAHLDLVDGVGYADVPALYETSLLNFGQMVAV